MIILIRHFYRINVDSAKDIVLKEIYQKLIQVVRKKQVKITNIWFIRFDNGFWKVNPKYIHV